MFTSTLVKSEVPAGCVEVVVRDEVGEAPDTALELGFFPVSQLEEVREAVETWGYADANNVSKQADVVGQFTEVNGRCVFEILRVAPEAD